MQAVDQLKERLAAVVEAKSLDQLRGLGLLITHIPQGEQAGLIIEYRTH